MVDLDPQALQAKGLTAYDVSAAISAQNLILPSGTAKMGSREYTVSLNSSPDAIDALNNLPIRQVNGAMVYVRDVAQVHDGFAVQTNIVNMDGRRAGLAHHPEKRQCLHAERGGRRAAGAAQRSSLPCRPA